MSDLQNAVVGTDTLGLLANSDVECIIIGRKPTPPTKLETIVGAIVGGLFLLCGFGLIFWILRAAQKDAAADRAARLARESDERLAREAAAKPL